MRKRAAAAIVIALSLGMISGCAPGDISRYAAAAQQAGKAIFEGEAAPAAAEPVTEADRPAALEETQDSSDSASAAAAESQESAQEPKETESVLSAPEGIEQQASGKTEDTAVQESSAAEETEDSAAAETAESAALETPDSTVTEAEKQKGAAPKAETASAVVPAMMAEVPQNVQTAFAAKAALFSGHLAGKDAQSRTEKAAMQAVLQKESYDGRTLCLQNAGQYDGKNWGSYLLLFDSTSLTARERVRGDLWFFDGEKAQKIVKEAVFTQARLIAGGGKQLMMIQTEAEQKVQAQVYMAENGQSKPCFENAAAIEETEDGLCVFYDTDYFQYDPLVGEWTGARESVPYFYEAKENGFELQAQKKLTAEEYLSYIQPAEGDAAAAAFQEQQEEQFYTVDREDGIYSYGFFSVGVNRIGYQERKIGWSSIDADEISHAVAEYSYGIFELNDGKLAADGRAYRGKGFRFVDPEDKDRELAELNAIPAAYQDNRIALSAGTRKAAANKALQAVCEIQEYPADALCFIFTGDYDGDGKSEAFVAAGVYDGAFGAPVCDLWYVGDDMPQLLIESWPMRECSKYTFGKTEALLFHGYEITGVEDQLFCVTNHTAQRCLPDAGTIWIGKDQTLMARTAGGTDTPPGYYRLQEQGIQEDALQDMKTKALTEYDNGRAVYRRLLSLTDGEEGRISCLRRDNGLIHVMLTAADDSVSYETWRIEKNSLILVDSGTGGYSLRTGAAQEKEADAALQEENTAEGQETSEGENNG